jgi:hypothetical protein
MSPQIFARRMLWTYLWVVGGITIAMGMLGSALLPEERIPYSAFFSPVVYAAVAMLPSFVMYSRKELPARQYAIRRVVHLLLLLAAILGMLAFLGLRDLPTLAAVAVSVVVIDLGIWALHWLHDSRESAALNEHLAQLQRRPG